jgi:uncharacterized protein YdcH (DUF465 family)
VKKTIFSLLFCFVYLAIINSQDNNILDNYYSKKYNNINEEKIESNDNFTDQNKLGTDDVNSYILKAILGLSIFSIVVTIVLMLKTKTNCKSLFAIFKNSKKKDSMKDDNIEKVSNEDDFRSNIKEVTKNQDNRITRLENKYYKLDERINDIEINIENIINNLKSRPELKGEEEVNIWGVTTKEKRPELRPEFRLEQKFESVSIIQPKPGHKKDPVISFNFWAANPLVRLPEDFYYIKGDMCIRKEQEIIETKDESRWITNRHGEIKYLFPNPNLFDDRTNGQIYQMEFSKINRRGQNKIKITNPCEMDNKGYIMLRGALDFL